MNLSRKTPCMNLETALFLTGRTLIMLVLLKITLENLSKTVTGTLTATTLAAAALSIGLGAAPRIGIAAGFTGLILDASFNHQYWNSEKAVLEKEVFARNMGIAGALLALAWSDWTAYSLILLGGLL